MEAEAIQAHEEATRAHEKERAYGEPVVSVGILSRAEVSFELTGPYQMTGSYCQGVVTVCRVVKGAQSVCYKGGGIGFDGQAYDTLRFDPLEETCTFGLKAVSIGIGFHWERQEDQYFTGALELLVADGKLTVVNHVPVEQYLISVISSEMSATASPELLKAHAVISRSWLLANIAARLQKDVYAPSIFWRTACEQENNRKQTEAVEAGELMKWYDRESHTRFDICADDHCQRYQGITRASTEAVRQAVAATRGEVLVSEGKICDTRFSKCCGGMSEEFRYCWENVRYPYLRLQRDWIGLQAGRSGIPAMKQPADEAGCGNGPDLTLEAEAERWIRTAPEAFCHTADPKVLSQVLNRYDQETTDFYRWRVEYTQDELSALIRERSGIDYGAIVDLVPVARGTSGRLWKLKIVGTWQTLVIGKELEIRRTLSRTHLYSSAFVVDREGSLLRDGDNSVPARFILTGAGWGHGVGLCQIGAAVMGAKGYRYDEILLHYYNKAEIAAIYS